MAITVVEGNPIKITGTTAASEVVATSAASRFIKFVYWYGPTTIGHLLSLKDRNGKEIVIAKCEAADGSQWLPVFTSFHDIYCDDMDSGTVFIYSK